jgi:gliding motility associated protien GldN
MKKLIFFIISISFLGLSITTKAQVLDPVNGPRAWKKENTKQNHAISLTHIREADVMWSKRVWRIIDLRQKTNLPLYYPIADSATLGKRSFVQVIYDELIKAVQNPGPDALKVYEQDELKNVIPADRALGKFSKTDTLPYVVDPMDCTIGEKPFSVDFVTQVKPEIIKVVLMEDWFFDKQRSVMDVRILALALVLPIYQSDVQPDPICTESVFNDWIKVQGAQDFVWFFYPDLRQVLAENECFKRHNDAARISFDDIFLKRMFASYITKEENVYDRAINDYTAGLDALLEAEKISENVRNFEMDLWHY